MSSYLVVAATAAEAAHVSADLPLVITGLGKTAAAATTARALAAYADTSGLTVLTIGTAGALRPGLSGLFEPGVVLNHDISADLIRSLGVPARLVKHVSDAADESAMDWPSMVEASAVALGAWLRENAL